MANGFYSVLVLTLVWTDCSFVSLEHYLHNLLPMYTNYNISIIIIIHLLPFFYFWVARLPTMSVKQTGTLKHISAYYIS